MADITADQVDSHDHHPVTIITQLDGEDTYTQQIIKILALSI